MSYPNMVDGIFPNHNISARIIIRAILSLTLPDKRPMDNMKLNVDVPLEQDWSISNMCLLSPYSGAYFPNNFHKYFKYSNFKDTTPKEKEIYTKNLKLFLQNLTYKYNDRQIILKSPMDTARVKLLNEIFPDAKFVHIIRNPYEVYFSTLKLHTLNKDIYPLQKDRRDLSEFVLQTFEDVMKNYYEEIKIIPKERLIEIRYEELTKDRLGVMRKIYTQLNLKDFSKTEPRLNDYIKSLKNYVVDEYKIKKADKKLIYNRWKKYVDKWEYNVQTL